MHQPADFQDFFARALLDPVHAVPAAIRGAARRRADRRFAVHRNNVVVGLINALAERFPVVSRLVGDEFFRAMARLYATMRPPASPLMMLYGETFPEFIDAFAPAAALPYLGDIARLEYARGRAITPRMRCRPARRSLPRFLRRNSVICACFCTRLRPSSHRRIPSYRSGR